MNGRAGRVGILALSLAVLLVAVGALPRTAPPRLRPVADPVADQPYRIGYDSQDVPDLAEWNPDSAEPVRTFPASDSPADQPAVSPRSAGLVYLTHQAGQVTTDVVYQATPNGAARLLTTGSTNRHPALSPDGKLVAFDSDRTGQYDIWVVGVDGTGLHQVTTSPAADTWPTWSPDGTQIAFGSTRDDPNGDIYRVPVAGGTATRLTEDPGADTQPSWSSTGRIAFTTTRFGTTADIATMSALDGTGVTRQVTGEQAAWAPDGGRLAYVTRAADPSGDIAILNLTVNPPTSGPMAQDNPNAETHPSWGPAGVVYTFTSSGAGSDVWSADATGQDRRDATNRPNATESHPAYSPDGRFIAYTEEIPIGGSAGTPAVTSGGRIVVADADGRSPRAVTQFVQGRYDEDAAWSPDGTRIAFTRTASDETSSVQVVRASDGASLGGIPNPAGISASVDNAPTWSADGRRIAFSRSAGARTWAVVPGAVDRPVVPGGSTSVDQLMPTPAIPPNPDVVLLVDTTSSMDSVIANVRTNLQTVIGNVRAAQPSAQFAVASFRDVGDGAELFRVRQDLTSNATALQTAVNGLASGGGGDAPEDWLDALYNVSTGAISFRSTGSPIVVLISDAPAHTGPSEHTVHTLDETIGALKNRGARVVAVNAGTTGGGIDQRGQATQIVTATSGQLVNANTAADVSAAVLTGLHNLPVTVTPKVTTPCDSGLSITFSPAGPTTVVGGATVTYRQTVAVAATVPVGTHLHCTVNYQLTPNSGGSAYVVPVDIQVTSPDLPRVTVDNVTVKAPTDHGVAVTYTATATDVDGTPLTPVCRPPSGSVFPIGETDVVCTATGTGGRVGRDTAQIAVISPSWSEATRVWIADVTFPATGPLTTSAQIDLSATVGGGCDAGGSDLTPAWSPDGTRIAFVAASTLCVTTPTGAAATTLVSVPVESGEYALDPAWSPDGRLIGYGWNTGGGTWTEGGFVPSPDQIRTVPATGGTPTVVIDTPNGADRPTFRPLGSGLSLSVAVAPQPAYAGAGPVTATYTLRNTARFDATQVWLATDTPFNGPGATFVGTLAAGAQQSVTVSVPARSAVTGAASGALTGVFPEDQPMVVRARADLTVSVMPGGLTLTVVATPQPVYVGGSPVTVTYTVANTAPRTATGVTLTTDIPIIGTGTTAVGTLLPGATASFTFQVPATRAVTGAAMGTVTGVYPIDQVKTVQAWAILVITQPALTLNPGLGPPGFVTVASGINFPPGSTVRLAWQPGITAPTSVVVRPDGTFQVQVLVFYQDQVGGRVLTATGTGFGTVTAPFLVVPGSQQPQDFVERR